ncbi:Mannan endo-1,4-beta-mannosidase 1 [Hordeum vulgare]|nr:Mannan endo-1,4-beta-mannosidase 1 [Hordeum vulgare]
MPFPTHVSGTTVKQCPVSFALFKAPTELQLSAIVIQFQRAQPSRPARDLSVPEGMRLHHGAPVALFVLVLLCVHGGREAEAAGGGFVRAQGTRFVINGSPYYANGFNAYWLMTMAADPAQRGKVTSALSQAAARGLSVARTWAFSDGGSNALQSAPGSYNENIFKGLDFVLSEARKNGIKVILSLVNNYDTFGGKKQYVEWARGRGRPSDLRMTSSLTLCQGLLQEPCQDRADEGEHGDRGGVQGRPRRSWRGADERAPVPVRPLRRTIQSWITEMAAHVKSIDGNHMLEAGLEGFYGASSSSSRAASVNPGRPPGGHRLHRQQPGPRQSTSPPCTRTRTSGCRAPTTRRSGTSWAGGWTRTSRTRRGRCASRLLIAEFGKSQRDPGFSSAQRDAQFGMVYAKIYQSARKGGPRWAGSSGSSWPTAWTPTGTATSHLRGGAGVHHRRYHVREPQAQDARQGVRAG